MQYIVVDATLYADEDDADVVYATLKMQEETRRIRRNAKAGAARAAKKNAKPETRELRIARNFSRRVLVALR